jgi:hypothetical protein
MAYVQPPQFAHGDYPTAANLNKIADNLDDIHGTMGDGTFRHYPVIHNLGNGFTFFHVWRWLLYAGSSGEISDPTGAQTDTIALPDVTSGFGVYDLRQVSWIHLGRNYEVANVDWCQESRSSGG